MANILLVESYKNLASLYQTILTDEGHHVLVVSDCEKAMEHALTAKFELVDEGLPDRCEEELIRNLKKIQPHIKAIVCSLDEFSPTTYLHLCDEGFIKTYDYTILQEKIKRLAR